MSSSNSPCAACKFLRRKCTVGCILAPYFPPDQPTKFANVHKVFGASNVGKLLVDLPAGSREQAVISLAYEAQARLHDPVLGCVGHVYALEQRLAQVRSEIDAARKELAMYIGPAAYGSFLQQAVPHHHDLVGGAFHQHQYPYYRNPQGASSSSMPPPYGTPGLGLGMGLGLAAPASIPQEQILMRDHHQQQAQMLMRDQQQQQQAQMLMHDHHQQQQAQMLMRDQQQQQQAQMLMRDHQQQQQAQMLMRDHQQQQQAHMLMREQQQQHQAQTLMREQQQQHQAQTLMREQQPPPQEGQMLMLEQHQHAMLMHDQQQLHHLQQRITEDEQLALAIANVTRDQEMLRNFAQQQQQQQQLQEQELFNLGLPDNVRGYDQLTFDGATIAVVAEPPSGLALVPPQPFDGSFLQEPQQQPLRYNEHHHHQYNEEQLLQEEQQHTQPHHHRVGSDERRSTMDPSS